MRKLELGEGIFVLPLSLVERVERNLDASEAAVFVVYPDESSGADVARILEAASNLVEDAEST